MQIGIQKYYHKALVLIRPAGTDNPNFQKTFEKGFLVFFSV